jgi:predicted secreted protein
MRLQVSEIMNWDAIGAIAELLGAIGVIASLVFLAMQLRQNTHALRAGAYQQYEQNVYSRTRDSIAIFEQLDEDDKFRFGVQLNYGFRSFDNAYYQYRAGLLDEDRWQISARTLVSFLQNPGVAHWWRSTPSTLSPEFIALVEEILGEEAEAATSATAR